MEHHLTLPLNPQQIQAIRAGDMLYLSGTIYTARDAAHRELARLIEEGEPTPIEMQGAAVYYAGPCPAPEGFAIGSVGPTTSSRMDKWAPDFIARGMRIMIGKGPRAPQVADAIRTHTGLYLSAAGGAGALYATCVRSAKVIAFEHLGAEAIRELWVEEMPLIAAIDCHGGNLYASGAADNAFSLRKTQNRDIPQVMALYRAVVAQMRTQGFGQWSEAYPNRDLLEADIARGNSHAAFLGEKLIAAMTVDGDVASAYDHIKWRCEGPAATLHRLCVHPNRQGDGTGRRMLAHAHEIAREMGARCMRIDTGDDNATARKFYQKAGYVEMGHCHLPRTQGQFVVLEKDLKEDAQ